MADNLDHLRKTVREIGRGPFLFIGSGLSRRYLGSFTWEDLLRSFCKGGKDFEYYRSKANGDLPKASSLLAVDFHEYWWGADEYARSREHLKSRIQTLSDPLKFEIASHLKSFRPVTSDEKLIEEMDGLRSSVIDGVITTNWDQCLEALFPDFKVFVGQNSLLFSNPVSMAEIYKIHGCCTDPGSLVLTEEDYAQFSDRNVYLAAKLLNIFLEHPIFFLGYSLSDPHVTEILESIVACLGKRDIERLQNRLFFVAWNPQADTAVRKSFFRLREATIPISVIETENFLPVYSALTHNKRKIPPRILRYCKEQLFELIQNADPKERLCVLSLDDKAILKDEVEFVVGVGVSKSLSDRGYSSITRLDVLRDILFNDQHFDSKQLLSKTVPLLLKSTPYVPVFKYLRQLGIVSSESFLQSGLVLDKAVNRKPPARSNSYEKRVSNMTLDDLKQTYDPEHALFHCAYLDPQKVHPEELLEFLKEHWDTAIVKKTSYGKAVCLYDRIAHGWQVARAQLMLAARSSSSTNSVADQGRTLTADPLRSLPDRAQP